MAYNFKTEPYPFQRTIWEDTKDKKTHALFMEQGTGKTKVTLDTVGWQYHLNHVKNLMVVAPSGVHRNWVADEIPKHLPDGIPRMLVSYQTNRAGTRMQKEALDSLMRYSKGLSVLAMSYDAFMTQSGKNAAWEFMKKKKLMHVLDESTRIKNPKADRTKVVMKSGPYSDYRRILSGTPVANGPFDIWAPINFLDPQFWIKHRLSNFFVFRHYFGNIVKRRANLGHEFEFVSGYRNLHELHDLLKPLSTRVTKAEVLKDLPPKVYSTRYFEMSPEQEKIYRQVEQECEVMLEGHVLTMELALTRLLRLQQVTCGYLPRPMDDLNGSGTEEPYITLPGKPARLNALSDATEDISTQGIIWARFTRDIDLICDMLNQKGRGGAVRYDGTQNEDQRANALTRFRNQEAQWFVGNAAVGGEGLTLTEAKIVIYYNNSFKFTERAQSEDRPHRIGQDSSVSYIDLAAIGTVDEDIVRALLKKLEIANIITGDAKKDWIGSPDEYTGSDNFELCADTIADVLNMFNN